MINWRPWSAQAAAPSPAGGEDALPLPGCDLADRLRRLPGIFLSVLALWPSVSVKATGEESPPVFTANELGVSVTHWSVENGLPTQDIRAVAQTPEAFIWCGTPRGLVRFDGVRFTVYDGRNVPVLDGVEIEELAVDGAGRLWLVGHQNEVVVLEDGVFHRLGVDDGLPENVNLARPDSQGNMWFKGNEAFYKFEAGSFVPVSCPGLSHRNVVDFHFAPDGAMWAVLEAGRQLALIAPDHKPRTITALADVDLGRFFALQDGSLGLSSSRGLFQLHEGRWQRLHARELHGPLNFQKAGAACEDPAGNHWGGTYDQGLFVWLPDGRGGRFRVGSESVTWVRALMCDAQGNVWVGKRDGLFRLRPTAFRNWAEEAGMARSYVHSLAAAPDGTVWFANGWELSFLRPKAQRIERVRLPVSADKTWCVHVARDGTVWAGDLSGQLFRWRDGAMQRVGSVTTEVMAIFDGADGTLWVGSTGGLWRLEPGGLKRVPVLAGDAPVGIRSITGDPLGRLNVLAFGIGIFRREGESWRPVPRVPEPAARFIRSLHSDSEGTLWAAMTTHGFGRLKNDQWAQFDISTPAGPAAFEGVAVDPDGHVWLPSHHGLFRVRRHLLAASPNPKTITEYRRFDRNDGLGSVACTSIACVVGAARDGTIWVGTQNGAAATDLKTLVDLRERSESPRTIFESVQCDEQPPMPLLWKAGTPAATEIVVPASVLRLRISYTATRVQFPEKATFQYRLLGLAEDWVQAGTDRQATFLKLAPGRYQFQVRSANRHGDSNFAPALLGLRVLPTWWQRGWFRSGAGLLGAGLLWLAYARRMRRLKREQALHSEFSRQLLRSQELERKRIASELHDSLGQNLLVAKNLALMGRNGSAAAEATARQFEEISQAVSEALSETRRISRALRPPELDRMGLTKALRGMVQRSGEASGIECRVTMDDIDGLLPAAEEINVYRLVQECMNNIVRHSRAARADVRVLHHPDRLELTIADDGRGFDVGKARATEPGPGGMGLTGMEERTRLAGGQFEITSQVGQGTVVQIRIPVKAPNA